MKVTLFLFAVSLFGFSSCATNEEFEERMNDRNAAYDSYNERRSMRLQARQDRTDAWFDRHMNTLD